MSGVYFPQDISGISYAFSEDSFFEELAGAGVFNGKFRDDSLAHIFRMAHGARYLVKENYLDQLDGTQAFSETVLEACRERPGPIHWYISPQGTLWLTLKVQDVNTHRIWTTYFYANIHKNKGLWPLEFTFLPTPFTVLPDKAIVDNFRDLLAGQTITVHIGPNERNWGREYQFALVNPRQKIGISLSDSKDL